MLLDWRFHLRFAVHMDVGYKKAPEQTGSEILVTTFFSFLLNKAPFLGALSLLVGWIELVIGWSRAYQKHQGVTEYQP
jgi:hypothetical protein